MTKREYIKLACGAYLSSDLDELDDYDNLVAEQSRGNGQTDACIHAGVWEPLEHFSVDRLLDVIEAHAMILQSTCEQDKKVAPEILDSLDQLIDYNWMDEKKSYEEEHEEVPEEISSEYVQQMDPDHIFYDLCVVHHFTESLKQ